MIKDNLINDLYSKCINSKYDINEKITDIMKGSNITSALDKVKEKILEKIENLQETLKLLEREISEYLINHNNTNNNNQGLLWKKYFHI